MLGLAPGPTLKIVVYLLVILDLNDVGTKENKETDSIIENWTRWWLYFFFIYQNSHSHFFTFNKVFSTRLSLSSKWYKFEIFIFLNYLDNFFLINAWPSQGINFINVLLTAFTRPDPESVKRYWWLYCIFYTFGIYECKSCA